MRSPLALMFQVMSSLWLGVVVQIPMFQLALIVIQFVQSGFLK